MLFILILFVISLAVLILFVALYGKKKKELKTERFYKYHLYKKIMNELTFPVFRYHSKSDCMVGNKKFVEMCGHRKVENFKENVEKWKKIHPAYNFNGLFF